MSDLKKLQPQILKIIFREIAPEDCAVFLFGSQVSGQTFASSDIDIGLLHSGRCSNQDFLQIQEALEQELPTLRKLDLVDFTQVSEQVKQEALKEIDLWHVGKNCRGLWSDLKPAKKN